MKDVYQLLYTCGDYSDYQEITLGVFDTHEKAVGMAGTFSRLSDAHLTDLLGEYDDAGQVVIRKHRLNRFRPTSEAFRRSYGDTEMDEKIYTVDTDYRRDDWGDVQFTFRKEEK
ncbi:hypothetical protein [Lacticaseibacillus songhuajiangensis]|jgi:hypothetical protein|uniref:hypothetical protein n=1 Tax=Lacticaseibacillus songhuajiangensis TaxID=1296539 RepID=UPI000F7AE1F7|nr:hypothetical protein [Lacticaseibacillus songhuajiangensis]